MRVLQIPRQNTEGVIKRLRQVNVFKWIHYGKPENSLVQDISQEVIFELYEQVIQRHLSPTSVLWFLSVLSPMTLRRSTVLATSDIHLLGILIILS